MVSRVFEDGRSVAARRCLHMHSNRDYSGLWLCLSGQVLNDRTVTQPSDTRPSPAKRGQPEGTKNHIEIPPITAIMQRASHFTFLEIHRFFSQSRRMGPNNSLSSNLRCIRGEDLAKHAAASNTNGVVGSSGNTTPMPPIKRNNSPNKVQSCKPLLPPWEKTKHGIHTNFHITCLMNKPWAFGVRVSKRYSDRLL